MSSQITVGVTTEDVYLTRHSCSVSIGPSTSVTFLPLFSPSLPRQPILCTRTNQWHLCTKHHIFNTNNHFTSCRGLFYSWQLSEPEIPGTAGSHQMSRVQNRDVAHSPLSTILFHYCKVAATAFKATLLQSITTRKVLAIVFLSPQRQHVAQPVPGKKTNYQESRKLQDRKACNKTQTRQHGLVRSLTS